MLSSCTLSIQQYRVQHVSYEAVGKGEVFLQCYGFRVSMPSTTSTQVFSFPLGSQQLRCMAVTSCLWHQRFGEVDRQYCAGDGVFLFISVFMYFRYGVKQSHTIKINVEVYPHGNIRVMSCEQILCKCIIFPVQHTVATMRQCTSVFICHKKQVRLHAILTC